MGHISAAALPAWPHALDPWSCAASLALPLRLVEPRHPGETFIRGCGGHSSPCRQPWSLRSSRPHLSCLGLGTCHVHHCPSRDSAPVCPTWCLAVPLESEGETLPVRPTCSSCKAAPQMGVQGACVSEKRLGFVETTRKQTLMGCF